MSVYAGDEVNGEAGYVDGKAKDARFSAPAGISVFYDWRDKFVYQGCFVDTDGDASRGRDGKVDAATRDLPVKAGSHARMNPTMCWRLCHAYKYFGVQRGTECWCGNNENAVAVRGVKKARATTPDGSRERTTRWDGFDIGALDLKLRVLEAQLASRAPVRSRYVWCADGDFGPCTRAHAHSVHANSGYNHTGKTRWY